MRINLWYSKDVKRWHWVLIYSDDQDKMCQHEAGEQIELRDALEDIARTVEHVGKCYQSEVVSVAWS